MDHEFKSNHVDKTPLLQCKIYKLSPLESEEAQNQIEYALEHSFTQLIQLHYRVPFCFRWRKMDFCALASTICG